MPRGVLGMNASMMEEYLKFICNRRLSQLGLPEQFAGVTNPFAWMSEMMDLRKERISLKRALRITKLVVHC
jgi:ribonucleoside-diphosphate reductase beta chain